MAELPNNIASILGVDFSGNVVNLELALFNLSATQQSPATIAPNFRIPTAQQEESVQQRPVATTPTQTVTQPEQEPYMIFADTNYIPLVNIDKTNFVNSIIYQFGLKVGINTLSPRFLLDVHAGSINISTTASVTNYGYKIDGYNIAYSDLVNNKIIIGDNTYLTKTDINTLILSGLIPVAPYDFPRYLTVDNLGVVSATEEVDAARIRIKGRNSTGSTLYRGTIVYMQGSTGYRPNFIKAQANSEATSSRTFGAILNDIPNNSDGYVVVIGHIDNLDTRVTAPYPFTTEELLDGDQVYLSPNNAGYVTKVKPSAPNHLVYIGKVTRTSPTNGTIVYQIVNGFEFDELHDVAIGAKTNKDFVYYDSSTNLWKNGQLDAILPIGGEVSGTYTNMTLVNNAVINKVLSTYSLLSGPVSSGDSIVQAIGRLQNQINGLSGSLTYKGTWNSTTNSPTITSGSGTNGWFYIVSTGSTGTTTIDGNSTWAVGDWIVFNGTVWQRIVNSSVTAVNGQTGVVTLYTDDVPEKTTPTNKYYTDARVASYLTGAISSILTTNLTASRALISDSSGKIAASTITSTELGYLSGVTSNIQVQINSKQPLLTNPITGTGTTNQVAYFNGTTTLTGSDNFTYQSSFLYLKDGGISLTPVSANQILRINLNSYSALDGTASAIYLRQDNTDKWGIYMYLPDLSFRIKSSASSLIPNINITSANLVGIYKSTPAWRLDVAGDVNINTGFSYRINGTPINTDNIPEGSVNKYYSNTFVNSYLVGAISTVLINDLTVSKALISNASGKIAVSTVSSTELGYVSGVLSPIQAQLDGKQGIINLTTNGTSGAAQLTGNTLNIPQYQSILTNPITGTGTSGQVAVFNGVNSITSSNAFVAIPASNYMRFDGSLTLRNDFSALWFTTSFDTITGVVFANSTNLVIRGVKIKLQIGDSDKLIVNSSGNISIGNENDSYKLDVSGSININGGYHINGTMYTVASASASGFLTQTDWIRFDGKQPLLTNPITGTSVSGRVAFFNGTTTITGDSGLFWDNTNKRLGINTATPAYALDVVGQIKQTTVVSSLLKTDANGLIVAAVAGTDYLAVNASTVVPSDRTITINNVTFDLSANRSWTITTGGVSGTGTSNYLPKWSSTTALTNSNIIDDGSSVSIFTAPTAAYTFNVKNGANKYKSLWTPTLNGVDGIGLLFHNGGGLFDQTPAGFNASKFYFGVGISTKMFINSSSVFINRNYDELGNISGGGALQVNGSVNITGGQFMVDGVPITAGGGGTAGVSSFNGRTGIVSAIDGDYILNLLGDVSISNPQSNQVLIYNGNTWINGTVSSSGGTTTTWLKDLTNDVSVSYPVTDGYVLTWESSTSRWKAKAPSGGGVSGNYISGSGTVSPYAYLPIFNGTTSITNSNLYQNGGHIYTSTGINIYANAFYDASDARLKQIESRDGDIAWFKWKNGVDDLMHIGYIAQEIKDKYPNQVVLKDDGYYSVNYTEILVHKVAVLEAKVKELEIKLNM